MASHQFENQLLRKSIDETTRLSTDEPSPRSSMDEQVVPVLQRTVRQVLDEAHAIAVKMREAQEMCEHVLLRLEEIAIESAHVTPPPPLAAINRYTTILTQYLEFLKQFASKKAVFRLVQNRVVVRENLRFHHDIDNLLNGIKFPSGSRVLEDWRPQWEAFRAAQYVAFKAMSRNRVQLLHNVRPQDTHTQSQALGLIMFEYNRVNSVYTEAELQMLHNAFNIVSRFSGNRTPTNKTWLLPPYEVQVNDTPFAWGSYGDVHFGKLGGSDVAVKRMRIPKDVSRAAFVASFIKEANIWFSANKIPNVVRLYGAYYDDEEPYFVSEYAANGTLRSYLFKEEGRRQTWKLLRQVANGIVALHKMDILHNDLKCDNILVGADGVAKITDFGLCCKVLSLPPACEQRLSEQQDAGAIPWKAPEILAKTRCPSFESDIYSFGMCIVEAVTGEFPWHKTAPAMIRRRVKNGKLPPRPESGFDDDQWALVTQMCALDPNDRLPMEKVVKKLHEFKTREANAKRRQRCSSLLPPLELAYEVNFRWSLDFDDDSPRSSVPRLSSDGYELSSPETSPASAGITILHGGDAGGTQKQHSLSTLMESISEDERDEERLLWDQVHIANVEDRSTPLSDDPPEPVSPKLYTLLEPHQLLPEQESSLILAPETTEAKIPQPSISATQSTSREQPPHDRRAPELVSVAAHMENIRISFDFDLPKRPAPEPGCVIAATVNGSRYVTLNDSKKQIVQYEVVVRLAEGTEIRVWKRFSAFRNFQRRIRRQTRFHTAQLAPFPSRFAVSGSLSTTTVNHRTKLLGTFLKSVVTSTDVLFGVLVSENECYYNQLAPGSNCPAVLL